jgi:hypothetical protein
MATIKTVIHMKYTKYLFFISVKGELQKDYGFIASSFLSGEMMKKLPGKAAFIIKNVKLPLLL